MIKSSLYIITLASTLSIFDAVHDFQQAIPIPAELKEDPELTKIKQTLTILKRDLRFAKPILISSKAGDIDPVLWACIVESESEYSITARSNKGYKGLSQTPKAVGRTGYETADLTYGAAIYREKMQIAKGNPKLALALYKGGDNKQAHHQAEQVYKLYSKVKGKINELERKGLDEG